MKKLIIIALLAVPLVAVAVVDKATQDFINSIHFNSKPTKRYINQLGLVTEYSDDSIKIDNYRGKGGTFHLSGDKEEHIELDSAGNKVRSSADRGPYTPPKLGESKILRHKDGTLEHYFKSIDPNGEVYVILDITYPDGITVRFGSSEYPFHPISYYEPYVGYLINAINNINTSEVMEFLQENTKNLKKLINQRQQKTGNTPLLTAVKHALMSGLTSQQFSDLIKIIQALLEAGANPNIRDAQGNTPLLVTVKKTLMSGLTSEQSQTLIGIIKALLAAGADPTIADAQGNTPITLAATKPAILQVFMKAAGQPIFYYIKNANKNEVIAHLPRLRQESDINTMRNTKGQTPLVYAFTLALQTYNQMKQAQEHAAKVKNMVEKEKREASASRLKALYENIKAWEAHASALHTQFIDFIYIAQALINAGATLNNESGKKFLQDNGTAYRTILSPLLEI